MGFQTDCTTAGEDRRRFHGSVPPPIYESSLFTFPTYQAFRRAATASPGELDDGCFYSRVDNPTVRVLERKVALLERGGEARAFASGMAAISAALLSVARAGDHVIAARSLYSNSHRLLTSSLPALGIATDFVDFTDLDAVRAAIRPNTRALYLESPGNPAMLLIDIAATADLARERDLVTIIDNTLATPFNQRPLEMGIDLVVHSASKYFSGHSDVVAGMIVGDVERVTRIAANEQRDLGGILPPMEAWLILRGLRTLGLRMRAHNAAGLRVATWLEDRAEIERVHYAGLPSHPQYDLARRQMGGFSGMVSCVVRGGMQAAERFVDRLQLFGIGVSWGGFESLALPVDPASSAFAEELGIVPGFVRLSIGLEDVDDLLCDLQQALEGVCFA